MPKKMFLLVCMNEEIRLVDTPTLYPTKPAAEAARDKEVENTLQMLRAEGWDEENESLRYEGGCSPVVRYGNEYLYTWEITEIQIPD